MMERFVEWIVAGGLVLLAGLWLLTLRAWSLPWLIGVGGALLGTGGLARGIWRALEGSDGPVTRR